VTPISLQSTLQPNATLQQVIAYLNAFSTMVQTMSQQNVIQNVGSSGAVLSSIRNAAALQFPYYTSASAVTLGQLSPLSIALLAGTTTAQMQATLGINTWTPFSFGTVSTGTITPNPASGLKQSVTNDGAFTISATAQIGDVQISVTNGASAGTISFSGFTKQFTGDTLDTVPGHNFVIFIYGFPNGTAYLIKALQ
jgi:hypothetical protein